MRIRVFQAVIALAATSPAIGQGTITKDQAASLCKEQGEVVFQATLREQQAAAAQRIAPTSTTTTCNTVGTQTTCTSGPDGWSVPIAGNGAHAANAFASAHNARLGAEINCMKRLGFR